MRIVILGQNRSGTTAIYSLLRDSWQAAGGDPVLQFEPPHGSAPVPPPDTDALVKVLFVPGRFAPIAYAGFERCLLVLRDPRDVLVSQLLYSLHNSVLARDAAKANAFLAALAGKEADPAGVPLVSLFRTLFALDPNIDWDRYLERVRYAAEWNDDGWFHVRYEEFVDGEREDLERQVGFRLLPEAVVDAGHRRVVRTKTHGLWRQWFTPEDVEFFDSTVRPYCERFGYDADAEPDENPVIETSHATEYVRRLLTSR
ncbi:MAG: hypothetical protein R3B81_00845 [bacterium]